MSKTGTDGKTKNFYELTEDRDEDGKVRKKTEVTWRDEKVRDADEGFEE